jgi:hypothetical protein
VNAEQAAEQLEHFVNELRAGRMEVVDDHLGGTKSKPLNIQRPIFYAPGVLTFQWKYVDETGSDLD